MEHLISVMQKIKINVSDPDIDIDKDRVFSNEIDEYIRILTNAKVRCVVAGEFSSGKSSLINAIINYSLLPTADIPMTSKCVEISHSEQPIIKCYWREKVSKITKTAIESAVILLEKANHGNAGKFPLKKIQWNNDSTQITYIPSQLDSIQKFLWDIESYQPTRHDVSSSANPSENLKKSKRFMDLWNVFAGWIKKIYFRLFQKTEQREKIPIDASGIDRIEIGLTLPEKLKNICFVDIPGEGALESHTNLIEQSLQHSQVILYVLDGEHVGSKTSDQLIQLAKTNNSEVLFVLNKKDTLSVDGLNGALELLKKKYEVSPIPVSVLYAWTSYQLQQGFCTVGEVLNRPKINIKKVIRPPEWQPGDLEQNKDVLVDFLKRESCFDVLRQQVEQISGRGIEYFVVSKIKNILNNVLDKINTLMQSVSEDQEIWHQEKLIQELNERIQNINSKMINFQQNLTSSLRNELTSAFDAICDGYKKILSSLLSLNFKKVEKNAASILEEKFSQNDFTLRIQNIWHTVCIAEINNFKNEMSQLNLDEIPVITFEDWSWSNRKTFSQSVINKTTLIVKRVLGNTVDRPFFPIFRPGAMNLYMKKQKERCLLQWSEEMKIMFQHEQDDIESSIKCRTDNILVPVEKYLTSVKAETERQKSKLSALQNMRESKIGKLQIKQNELQKLAIFLINAK